jgi:hydrogenase/urease accessory protein HupE
MLSRHKSVTHRRCVAVDPFVHGVIYPVSSSDDLTATVAHQATDQGIW